MSRAHRLQSTPTYQSDNGFPPSLELPCHDKLSPYRAHSCLLYTSKGAIGTDRLRYTVVERWHDNFTIYLHAPFLSCLIQFLSLIHIWIPCRITACLEGRADTARWDPTSPVFIIDDTLCIPTVFISYTEMCIRDRTINLLKVKG